MMDEFSDSEWEFLTELSPMHLKPGILKKIETKLQQVHQTLIVAKKAYAGGFPSWRDEEGIKGKVYRGENYLGMPWIALDYPRNYGQNTSLAFRILVLWGDGIYTSLLSEGDAPVMMSRIKDTLDPGLDTYFVHSNNRWIQHISEDECTRLMNHSQAIAHRNTYAFTRLFQRIGFEHWSSLEKLCLESFQHQCGQMLEIMQKPQVV